MLRIRGKSTSLICWEENRQICRNSGGIDCERVGNIVFPTPFSKLKLINSDIEKLKHNIIINNIAVWGRHDAGVLPRC